MEITISKAGPGNIANMKRGPEDLRNGSKSAPRGGGGVSGWAPGTGKHVCNPCKESHHYAKGYTIS